MNPSCDGSLVSLTTPVTDALAVARPKVIERAECRS